MYIITTGDIMKKIIVGILILSSFLFGANMGEGKTNPQGKKQMKMFQSVPMKKATILQAGDAKIFCPSCGMTLPMFYKTNHAATHNGHTEQYCSLHCLTEVNMKNGGSLKDIKVVDVTSLTFIDARNATYVVGSSKKATMSKVSKYAFSTLKAAEAFKSKYGGEIMDFYGALEKAKEDFKYYK